MIIKNITSKPKTGGVSVIFYPSVSELKSQSELGLQVGYYGYDNQVVYWDGDVFYPPLLLNMWHTNFGNSKVSDDYSVKIIDIYLFPTSIPDMGELSDSSYSSDIDTGTAWSVI